MRCTNRSQVIFPPLATRYIYHIFSIPLPKACVLMYLSGVASCETVSYRVNTRSYRTRCGMWQWKMSTCKPECLYRGFRQVSTIIHLCMVSLIVYSFHSLYNHFTLHFSFINIIFYQLLSLSIYIYIYIYMLYYFTSGNDHCLVFIHGYLNKPFHMSHD